MSMDENARRLRCKIDRANRAFSLFAPDDGVLVALSGGADSVALLLALKGFYPSLRLCACHVNHKLRPGEAESDAAFAAELCRREQIPFELLEADVASLAARENLSVELAARRVRYDFFEKVCRKRGLNAVATAHTASDNAETVLFHLTRGTGLTGLAGIPPKRAFAGNASLIRPLIFATRAEIEAFLASRGQNYVTDSTNLCDDYTRNFFRHHVLPLLKQVNPSFEENLKNTCAALRDAQIFIEKTANNNLTDDVRTLSTYDECVLRQCIRELYQRASGQTLLEGIHIEKIAALVREDAAVPQKRHEVCLPGRFSAVIADGRLFFEPTKRKTQPDFAYSMVLTPGFTAIPGTPFGVYLCTEPSGMLAPLSDLEGIPPEYALYDSVLLDAASVKGELFVRNRRNGDTLRCGGMTKKVKEMLNHKKIPVEVRNTLPFICDQSGVLYVTRAALCDAHRQAVGSAHSVLRLLIFHASL